MAQHQHAILLAFNKTKKVPFAVQSMPFFAYVQMKYEKKKKILSKWLVQHFAGDIWILLNFDGGREIYLESIKGNLAKWKWNIHLLCFFLIVFVSGFKHTNKMSVISISRN